jgi:hypothetical protein
VILPDLMYLPVLVRQCFQQIRQVLGFLKLLEHLTHRQDLVDLLLREILAVPLHLKRLVHQDYLRDLQHL